MLRDSRVRKKSSTATALPNPFPLLHLAPGPAHPPVSPVWHSGSVCVPPPDESTPEQLVVCACPGWQTRGGVVAAEQGGFSVAAPPAPSQRAKHNTTKASAQCGHSAAKHNSLVVEFERLSPSVFFFSLSVHLSFSLTCSLHLPTPPNPTLSQTGSDAAICNDCKAGTYRREYESFI